MSPRRTSFLLILAAVLANLAFTALGSIFNYPSVLDEPAGAVLASFRDHQGAVSGWFGVLALSSALLAPIAIGVGRLAKTRAMRVAVWVGVAAAAVQVVGLMRWPILVPGYASDAVTGSPGVAASARDSFTTASDILGTGIGETLGYLLTATWTVLVIVALGILSAALPFSLEMSALRRLTARAYGVLASLEPAIATVVGVVALGQTLHATDALATLLVVTASVGATIEGSG